jgi:hypothetical protein
VKEILDHSIVIVFIRYARRNLGAKVRAVGKLAGDS